MTQLATTLALSSVLVLAGCSAATTEDSRTDEAQNPAVTTEADQEPASSDVNSDAPSLAEVESALRDLAQSESAEGTVDSVDEILMARDDQGRWWCSATVIPVESANTDDAQIYAYKDGEQWVLVFLGTNSLELELPSEVAGELAARR